MTPFFFRKKKYWQYRMHAMRGVDAHSPFIYNMSVAIFNKRKIHPAWVETEQLFPTLKGKEFDKLFSHKKTGCLLSKLIAYLKVKQVIKIGLENGMLTLYMDLFNCKPVIYIFGKESSTHSSDAISKMLNIENSRKNHEGFNEISPYFLTTLPPIDLILITAEHDPQSVYQYFETSMKYASNNTVFIFENIYRSPEMATIWEKIKSHPQVTVTVDVYTLGMVWLRTESSKENFVIKY